MRAENLGARSSVTRRHGRAISDMYVEYTGTAVTAVSPDRATIRRAFEQAREPSARGRRPRAAGSTTRLRSWSDARCADDGPAIDADPESRWRRIRLRCSARHQVDQTWPRLAARRVNGPVTHHKALAESGSTVPAMPPAPDRRARRPPSKTTCIISPADAAPVVGPRRCCATGNSGAMARLAGRVTEKDMRAMNRAVNRQSATRATWPRGFCGSVTIRAFTMGAGVRRD